METADLAVLLGSHLRHLEAAAVMSHLEEAVQQSLVVVVRRMDDLRAHYRSCLSRLWSFSSPVLQVPKDIDFQQETTVE